jgi:hypothetical protein
MSQQGSGGKSSIKKEPSPINDFFKKGNTEDDDGEDGNKEESKVSARVTPYKTSSKEFSHSKIDFEIVTRYRNWLAEYFTNEFNYESTLFMNLNKVREFIFNESSNLPKGGQNFNYPREYDLVVRVDEIKELSQDEA